ncbi:MAG: peptidylprolyl isomerase [Planctomycetes bacterium]|nr:peptidylprolyl isomerase [Planctomycetota bacterium]
MTGTILRAALLLLALAATLHGQDAPAAARDDAVVLVLDGEPVSAADYAQWLLDNQGEGLVPVFAREHWLLEREAQRRGVRVSVAEVDAEVERQFAERIAGAFHGSRAEWLAELARTGRTESGVRLQRRAEVSDRLNGRALAAIDRVVPRDKVEREWWRKYGRNGRRYDLRLLQFGVRVVAPKSGTPDEWKAEEARVKAARRADAVRVRELLLAGADFGQLAQEHSTDAETRARRGKPAGGFDPQGWPGAFLDELEKLAPGAVSEPLYARGGWWLVRVESVIVTSFDEVEGELRAELLARGPEDDEIEVVHRRVGDGVDVRMLPAMHASPGDPELGGPDTPVISIGGEAVTRAEYARWIHSIWGEVYVRTFAEDLLVRRKAAELGIQVDEEEVQQRAREYVQDIIDKDFLENRQRWYDKLAVSGSTEADFLREQCRRLRTSLLVEKLVLREREVTDEEVRRRFASALGPDGVWREASKILVSSRYEELDHGQDRDVLAREAAAAIERARGRAVEIVARLRAGGDFAAIARAESDDLRTRSRGGVVAGAFRGEEYPDDVARVVYALPEGAISDPIAYGPTWLVFWVRVAGKPTFEEKRGELRRELEESRPGLLEVRAYRNVLAKGARVEVVAPGLR